MVSKLFEIPDLSGGINLKPSERFIKPNEVYTLKNVDLSEFGVLKSLKDKTLLTSISNAQQMYKFRTGRYLLTDNSNLYSYNLVGASQILAGFKGKFQAKKSGNFVYATDGTMFQKWNGADTPSQVGIERPSSAPTITIKPKATIVDCESWPGNWTVIPLPPNVDGAADATSGYFMEGDASVRIRIQEDFGTGLAITYTLASAIDATQYSSVGFWLKSDVNIDAGVLSIRLRDSGETDPWATLEIPEMVSSTWTYIVLPYTAVSGDNIKYFEIYCNTDIGKMRLWIDAIECDGGPLNGKYYWYYSYYSKYDQESALSDVSEVVSLERNQVTVTFGTSSDSQIDTRKLYRLGGALSTIYLVDTIEDNSTTTYNDYKNNNDLTVVATSQDYDSPQARIGGLLEYCDNRLFIAGIIATPKRLYFSRTTPYVEAWPDEYFIDFIYDITALFNLNEELLIFTTDAIYRLSGTTPSDYAVNAIAWSKSCFSPHSIIKFGGYALFLSNKGLYITNGTDVTYISEKIEDLFTVIDSNAYGIIKENIYYLIYNGQTIVADLVAFPNIRYYTFDYNPISYFYDYETNKFYLVDSAGVWKMEDGANIQFTVEKNQFGIDNPMLYKFLRKVWVNVSGNLTLEIYKENDSTAAYTKSYSTSAMTRKEFSLPYDIKAKFFKLKLQCTGTIEPPIILQHTSFGLQ